MNNELRMLNFPLRGCKDILFSFFNDNGESWKLEKQNLVFGDRAKTPKM
jgi:hypothetical protein